MRPAGYPHKDDASDVSARVSVCGHVSSCQHKTNTVVVDVVFPHNGESTALRRVSVHALMPLHAANERPYRRLPAVNTLLHFTGHLVSVSATVIQVAVDDITYLDRAPSIYARILRSPSHLQ